MDTSTIRQKVFIETLLIFLLPVLLLYFGIIPIEFRFPLLGVLVCAIIVIVFREKWGLKDFGIQVPTRRQIFLYIGATVLGFFSLLYYAVLIGTPLNAQVLTSKWFLLTFFPVSALQEVAYRGFLMPMLKKVFTDRMTIILVNAALFTVLHIIFKDPVAILPLSFIAGLFFSVLYMRAPNLILISICHAILNFFAILFGFFLV
ncbi:CPBP family intramembrane metalloprotease [Candidatus Nomurabacteria bacterium]|nr:CPBP family intramembrane metalloprotease [Candidatus Nomurabacteria bacterium]